MDLPHLEICDRKFDVNSFIPGSCIGQLDFEESENSCPPQAATGATIATKQINIGDDVNKKQSVFKTPNKKRVCFTRQGVHCTTFPQLHTRQEFITYS